MAFTTDLRVTLSERCSTFTLILTFLAWDFFGASAGPSPSPLTLTSFPMGHQQGDFLAPRKHTIEGNLDSANQ